MNERTHTGSGCRWLIAAAFAITLAGCGSSAPVRYYQLQLEEGAFEHDPEDSVVLGIGPLRMPEYLSRSQIVTRGEGTEILVDDFNRWAEPVEDSIYRVLGWNVDRAMEGVIVVAFPYNNAIEYEYQVVGNIARFDADRSGRAVLLAQWGIVAVDGEIVVPPRRVQYEATVAVPGDYGSIAAAMSDTLAQFGLAISEAFRGAVETQSE